MDNWYPYAIGFLERSRWCCWICWNTVPLLEEVDAVFQVVNEKNTPFECGRVISLVANLMVSESFHGEDHVFPSLECVGR